MARTYPISLADFWDTLGKTSVTLDLSEALASVDLIGGDTIPIDSGPRLWQGSVSTRLYKNDQVDAAVGLMEILRQAGATFRITKALRAGPAADLDGSILGASVVTISAVVSTREITLSGLPAGYTLTRGDMLSWSYLSGARHALHRIADTVMADGLGDATIEVSPFVRGDPTGATVTLIEPSCLAMLVPGSYSPPRGDPNAYSGISFNWIQVKP